MTRDECLALAERFRAPTSHAELAEAELFTLLRCEALLEQLVQNTAPPKPKPAQKPAPKAAPKPKARRRTRKRKSGDE